jgi:nitroimidazol reductase NimA-like FMN-containing flavoprotein (pyridoxamine 5'-phosphate oxidase superfamily)
MFIHTMTESECQHALENAKVGRLACAHDNRPYIVPIYFAYHERHLYAVSTMGQKIDWMRENPFVCVEVDDLTNHEQWMSVVVFGRYEELPDRPQHKSARELALMLLQKKSPWWWEPAYICEDHRDVPHSCTPVAFRIRIDRLSGLHATPDVAPPPIGKPVKRSWLAHILGSRQQLRASERNLP